MFNFLNSYKTIEKQAFEMKDKIQKAGKEEKSLINKLFIWGIILTIVIGVLQIVFFLVYQPKIQDPVFQEPTVIEQQMEYQVPDDSGVLDLPEEELGRGQSIPNPIDMLNPFSSFQESIVDAISEIIMQGLELFDDYVAFTPNIAKSDGQIVDARGNNIPIHVNKFYNATQSVAWLLLPLIIVLTGTYVVLEGSFKGTQLLKEVAKKVLLFVVGMVAMRFLFANAIDLVNALNRFVLNALVGSGDTLSESLLTALGMQIVDSKLELSIQGTLNIFAEIILWIGLFFLLVTILFQFIIRFFHLLLHVIIFPIVLVIGLLPSGGQFFKQYVEETLRTLFMQPIFLIGIGITLEIIQSVNEPVPKVILGLGSLAFLNIIPSIINRFSGILWGIGGSVAGGIVAGATVGQARRMKESVVAGASGGKSTSIRNLAGKALGEAIVSKLPIGGTAKKALDSGVALKSGGTTAKAGSFNAVVSSGGSATKAFSQLGMKPLSGRTLKDIQTPKTLYSTSPNIEKIKDLSVKDSNIVSNGYSQSNFTSSLGEPLTEKPATIHQMMDLSQVSFSNPNTNQYLSDVITNKPTEIVQGRTFDSGNDKHWSHLSEWYSKNQVLDGKMNQNQIQQYVQNPQNRMNIINTASDKGYFQKQGINTVKVQDKVSGQKPVTKYFQIKPINKDAGNSTAKTK